MTFDRSAEMARRLSGVSLLIIVASALVSLFTFDLVGEQMRIRWHVGQYVHYGPETISAAIPLVGIPVGLFGLYILARVSFSILEARGLGDNRWIAELGIATIFGGVLLLQAALIGLNVVLP